MQYQVCSIAQCSAVGEYLDDHEQLLCATHANAPSIVQLAGDIVGDGGAAGATTASTRWCVFLIAYIDAVLGSHNTARQQSRRDNTLRLSLVQALHKHTGAPEQQQVRKLCRAIQLYADRHATAIARSGLAYLSSREHQLHYNNVFEITRGGDTSLETLAVLLLELVKQRADAATNPAYVEQQERAQKAERDVRTRLAIIV